MSIDEKKERVDLIGIEFHIYRPKLERAPTKKEEKSSQSLVSVSQLKELFAKFHKSVYLIWRLLEMSFLFRYCPGIWISVLTSVRKFAPSFDVTNRMYRNCLQQAQLLLSILYYSHASIL